MFFKGQIWLEFLLSHTVLQRLPAKYEVIFFTILLFLEKLVIFALGASKCLKLNLADSVASEINIPRLKNDTARSECLKFLIEGFPGNFPVIA